MCWCSGLLDSVTQADGLMKGFLAAWSSELVAGDTDYGQRAYACLESNWPR